ncbi:MAG: hypothetical protein M3394_00530 [Actinomycetota bacterium]|nr:hypothetical protein [Actinomycetota bacterium]
MTHPIAAEEIPPIHQPYDPDDVIAFHAARLLLLLDVCGEGTTRRSIEGSTKLAKLDFFVRYPSFLARAHEALQRRGEEVTTQYVADQTEPVEAPMIRYRFGPWDPRYRQYLAFLEARQLVVVGQGARGTKKVTLTAAGRRLARTAAADPSYAPVLARADTMVGNLAAWTGSELKDFIYDLLADEVGNRPMGEVIT